MRQRQARCNRREPGHAGKAAHRRPEARRSGRIAYPGQVTILAAAAATNVALAPGLDPALDRTLPGLRGNTLAPAKGSWARLLRDTLEIELSAAGLYDPASSSVIAGELIESSVDAAIGTGTARLAARFRVTRGGEQVYERALDVEARWSSSFVGAIAIPEAINQYGALYKALVAKLIDDPDFRRALAK